MRTTSEIVASVNQVDSVVRCLRLLCRLSQGRTASGERHATAALWAQEKSRELSEEVAQEPIIVRVLEGREPPCMRAIFKGKLTVLFGEAPPGQRLYWAVTTLCRSRFVFVIKWLEMIDRVLFPVRPQATTAAMACRPASCSEWTARRTTTLALFR